MQSVSAYYDEGKFVPIQPVNIPEGSQAIITILDYYTGKVISGDASHIVPMQDNARNEWLNRLNEARELAKDEDLPEWPFKRSIKRLVKEE